jgi:23S rRNA (pseudouridine1915-N3)-methyltransferase
MLIRLVWVGRTRSGPAAEWIEEYRARISRYARIEIAEVKDAPGKGRSRAVRESREIVEKTEARGLKVALDPSGQAMTSEEFSRFVEKSLASHAEITFILGGPEGILPELAACAHKRLSLSRMTLTHEMARVFLLEQIYRAFTILKGTPYHK